MHLDLTRSYKILTWFNELVIEAVILKNELKNDECSR